MWRRRIADLTGLFRRFGLSLPRVEILAFFPLLSIAAAAVLNRPVAEITGIVLPLLLILDAVTRGFEIQPVAAKPSPTDDLTGLPPRTAIAVALDQVAAGEGRLTTACLYLRVDDMENLMQRWGADQRDEILRRATDRLRATLRSEDTLARIEDGTFGIVLRPRPPGKADETVLLSDRILSTLREPIHIGDRSVEISASIGIAVPDHLSIRNLAYGAEAALNDAQRRGAGKVRRFTAELRDRINRDAELVEGFENAIRSGEIRAWFQPQICTDSGEILGFEALARWHHPKYGVLTSSQFLDALARAGQMSRLGETILQNALAALASWDRKFLKIPGVSVNFSAEELRDPDLAERVKWEVDRYDIRPGRLSIEILESVAAQGDDAAILASIDQFESHGFHFDLDDFGTGQASIENIRRFRVQRIKIDPSFVAGVGTDPRQQSVVSAILALAHHLGIATLAEGVETPAAHSILAQLGCGAVQGHGIARPMPFEDTFAWIDAYRARAAKPPVIGRKTG